MVDGFTVPKYLYFGTPKAVDKFHDKIFLTTKPHIALLFTIDITKIDIYKGYSSNVSYSAWENDTNNGKTIIWHNIWQRSKNQVSGKSDGFVYVVDSTKLDHSQITPGYVDDMEMEFRYGGNITNAIVGKNKGSIEWSCQYRKPRPDERVPIKKSTDRRIDSFRTPEDLLFYLNKRFLYGYTDKKGYEYINDFSIERFYNDYRTLHPIDLFQTRVGVCWDYVELERYVLSRMPNIDNIQVHYMNNKNKSTHTFLTYTQSGIGYYFEFSWSRKKGIHRYNHMEDLIKEIHDGMIKDNGKDDGYIVTKLSLPKKYGLSVDEFMAWAKSQNKSEIRY